MEKTWKTNATNTIIRSTNEQNEYAPKVRDIIFIKSEWIAFVRFLFLAEFGSGCWNGDSSLSIVAHLGTQGLGGVSFAGQLLLTSKETQVK